MQGVGGRRGGGGEGEAPAGGLEESLGPAWWPREGQACAREGVEGRGSNQAHGALTGPSNCQGAPSILGPSTQRIDPSVQGGAAHTPQPPA